MSSPTVYLFICPDEDGFHRTPEQVAYLLIPGHSMTRRLMQKTHEDGVTRKLWAFRIIEDKDSYVLMDDPTEAWLTVILGNLLECEIIRCLHVCYSCQCRGIKQVSFAELAYAK